MKMMYALLIGVVVFTFAGVAHAQEDPYSGSYSCSGDSQVGCGECTDVEIYPPTGVVITKMGDTYQICPQYDDDSLGIRGNGDDCVTADIKNGVAHWSGTTSGQGETFTGEVTATFNGSTINAEESGQASGRCNCSVSLKAICTK